MGKGLMEARSHNNVRLFNRRITMKRSPPRPTIRRSPPPPPLPPFRNNDEDSWKVDTALAGANAAALALIPALVDASIAESQAVSKSLSMFAFGAICALVALAYDQSSITWDRYRGQNLASRPVSFEFGPLVLAGLLVAFLGAACFWSGDIKLAWLLFKPAWLGWGMSFVALGMTVVLRWGVVALILRILSFLTLTFGVIVTLGAQASNGAQSSAISDPDRPSSVNTIIRYGSPEESPFETLLTRPPRPLPPTPRVVEATPVMKTPPRRPAQGVPDRPVVAPLDEGGEKG